MTTFLASFCFCVAKTANISQIKYTKCSKCPPSAFTQARKRFPKFAIVESVLWVTRPRSSQTLTSVPGSPSAVDLFTKQNDVTVTSLLSWYSESWYSVVFSICKQDFDQ